MNMAGIGHNRPPGFIPSKRWIRAYSDYVDHPLVGHGQQVRPRGGWGDKRRTKSRYEAWEDLQFLARYKAGMVEVNGREEWLEVGQLFGAVSFLEERWNWSTKSIRNWLRKLEEEGLIVRSQPSENPMGKLNGELKGELGGKLEGEQKGEQKGKLNRPSEKIAPTIITLCNYSVIQGIEDLITVYVETQKGQTNGQTEGQAQGQAEGQTKGQTKGQQIHTDIHTGLDNRDDSRVRAKTREKDPDPFDLNPWRKSESVQRAPDGTLTLANGKRAEWLKQFEDDADLDLSLKQIADKIQPNSIKTIEVQVEAQLARIIQDRRDKDRRYQRAVDNGSKQRTITRNAPEKGMSIDERLRLERERKAQETQR